MKKIILASLAIAASSYISLSSSPKISAIPEEKDMGAYLFTFFNDSTHSLFMAISHDGYEFTAVNDGNPVIAGDTIAEQHGIRDPHIFRGPDGAFYLSMTDLHIYGREHGFRDTEWERDGKLYGWGNNRGIILMKSHDLINWTRSLIRIDQAFPEEFGDICCFWAPETTYDKESGKLMLYFTIRRNMNEHTDVYWSYVDDDYTHLTSVPQKLFEHPDSLIPVLDADICPMPDGGYFMTYVAQENPAGIRYMTSGDINRNYLMTFDSQIDAEQRGCEAPNTWKRIGEDKWVVMYDIYGIKPHNFGFIETSDFKTFTHLGRFNEGVMKATNFKSPKHGSVIQITSEEAGRLEEYWKK